MKAKEQKHRDEIRHLQAELDAEYEKIKDQPLIYDGGRMNHKLAGLLCLRGLLKGMSEVTK